MNDHLAKDRKEAGIMLAKDLAVYEGQRAIVLGLPRGGVMTAKEVATALNLPLCLVVVKKISLPADPEYAIGAVSESGEVAVNQAIQAELDKNLFLSMIKDKKSEAEKRAQLLRGECHGQDLEGKIAIIVDDGIATGYTMLAAIKEVKKHRPSKVVVASPVAPSEVVGDLKKFADEVVISYIPEIFIGSVGAYYQSFPEVKDQDVVELLKKSHHQNK